MVTTKTMAPASKNVDSHISLTRKLSKKEREELRRKFAEALVKFNTKKNTGKKDNEE